MFASTHVLLLLFIEKWFADKIGKNPYEWQDFCAEDIEMTLSILKSNTNNTLINLSYFE